MAPSFAELKAKAAKAKDASVSKIQSTRDRHTSVPLARTNWDPYSKQPPPPPPPPRVNANTRPEPSFPPPPNRSTLPPPPSPTPSLPARSSALSSSPSLPVPSPAPHLPSRSLSSSNQPSSGPPPIIRSTRPELAPRVTDTSESEIDWTDLSAEDKEVFFSWLDEFFSKFLNVDIPPRDLRSGYR
ncbi:hypothetical protein D9615_007981 [Tricholomella constricta]|uniref:Uncharacterized protein n=1 Tax=Tricholomella constricta TaxID=117010 RepID=A0A8H5H2F2_9AGAR|nr:hypothetical protein D9615_007981 [Tricholomella constricta]